MRNLLIRRNGPSLNRDLGTVSAFNFLCQQLRLVFVEGLLSVHILLVCLFVYSLYKSMMWLACLNE